MIQGFVTAALVHNGGTHGLANDLTLEAPRLGNLLVPKAGSRALLAVVGKAELKLSLHTRDPGEAKVAFSRVAAEVEARWSNLRAGVRSLSQKQAVAIAGEIYRELPSANEENPGDQGIWHVRSLSDYAFLKPEKVKVIGLGHPASKKMFERARVHRYRQVVAAFLDRKGLRVDDDSLVRVQLAVNSAMMQAHEQLLRSANGD